MILDHGVGDVPIKVLPQWVQVALELSHVVG